MKSTISSQIPKGEGKNFATKTSQEGAKAHTAVKTDFGLVLCTCCSRFVPGKIIHWEPNRKERKVLSMPCKSCGKWLGHLEQDNQDILDRMCLDCFEETISGGEI